MAKRKLRIVKTTPNAGGVCERCGAQFGSIIPDWKDAIVEITAAFNAHKCLLLDGSQNALRVVREATKDK
jgi:hypothetical protein